MKTLPETNIACESRPSQKESSIPTIHLQGAMLVSGRVANKKHHQQQQTENRHNRSRRRAKLLDHIRPSHSTIGPVTAPTVAENCESE